MMAWMNKMAIERTIRLHKVTYFSEVEMNFGKKERVVEIFKNLKC